MDIKGRAKINDALKDELKFGDADRFVFFNIHPEAWELRGGEEASEDAPENTRYIDVVTHANPSRVLECLRRANILERTGASQGFIYPELRLLGISANDRVSILTFEDIAQQ